MQTLETLRLRLTTNVTVSPASSARSSSAAARMSSIASGRVSANSAVSSSAPSGAPPVGARQRVGPRGRRPGARRARRGRAPARDEAPVARLDHVEHALRDPLRVDEARVHAQPLGERHPSCASRLRTWCGDGKGCSGEMWSPLADSPPRSVAPAADQLAATSRPGWAGSGSPTSGISRRASATSRSMSSTETGEAHAGARDVGPRSAGRCASSPRRPPWRSRPAPRRSSGGAGRSSAG